MSPALLSPLLLLPTSPEQFSSIFSHLLHASSWDFGEVRQVVSTAEVVSTSWTTEEWQGLPRSHDECVCVWEGVRHVGEVLEFYL